MAIREQCDDPEFVFTNTSGKIDYYGGTGGTTGPITWHTDGTYVWWESTKPINVAVIVKGGNNASVYYSGCGECVENSGMIKLSAPINPKNNKPYGLSNITFCYNECEGQSKIIAFKSYMTKDWAVTGGGIDNGYFIGCLPFVDGAQYTLYLNGQLSTPAGTLEIGNFDQDQLMEVRITSTIAGSYFTDSFLYVGPEGTCRTDYYNYPYQKTPPASSSSVIFDLPF